MGRYSRIGAIKTYFAAEKPHIDFVVRLDIVTDFIVIWNPYPIQIEYVNLAGWGMSFVNNSQLDRYIIYLD